MCLWSCRSRFPPLSDLPTEARRRVPHISWSLDLTSTSSLSLASSCPGVCASVYGRFWKNFTCVYFTIAPEPFAHGNLDTTSSFPRIWAVLCLRNASLDSGYMFLVSSRLFLDKFPTIFYVKGNSDPAVDSCPALRRVVFQVLHRMEKCAQSYLQLPDLRELVPLGNSDIIPTSPANLAVTCPLSEDRLRRVFVLRRTQEGWRGRRES